MFRCKSSKRTPQYKYFLKSVLVSNDWTFVPNICGLPMFLEPKSWGQHFNYLLTKTPLKNLLLLIPHVLENSHVRCMFSPHGCMKYWYKVVSNSLYSGVRFSKYMDVYKMLMSLCSSSTNTFNFFDVFNQTLGMRHETSPLYETDS